MTRLDAQDAADLMLLAGALAAACVIVTSPPLRRLARHGLRLWLGDSVPGFLAAEWQRGWMQSARRS